MSTEGLGQLVLADPESLRDLGRYAARARSFETDGAVRLQAVGGVLAAWVEVLPGRGLLREGATLGLRTSALAVPAEVDIVVPLAAVTDRVARPGNLAVLPIPPMTVPVSWTALTPPRSGWSPMGTVDAEVLRQAAADGIAEVASGTPEGAGGHAVQALRALVWGRPVPVTGGRAEFPAALALAAYALGFLAPDTEASVASSDRWVRLSTPAGHALTRR